VAEIPAKKFETGQEQKELAGRIRGRILPKMAEKGAEENFLKKFLILQKCKTLRGKYKI
jgi:hypothetical protein